VSLRRLSIYLSIHEEGIYHLPVFLSDTCPKEEGALSPRGMLGYCQIMYSKFSSHRRKSSLSSSFIIQLHLLVNMPQWFPWLLFMMTSSSQCNVVLSWITAVIVPKPLYSVNRGLKSQQYLSSSSSSPIVSTFMTSNLDSNSSTMEDKKNKNENDQVDDDDDDDEWEYIEFDSLTESDLIGSEWLVGTCWDNRPDIIEETWCRLVRSKDKDQNTAIWGDQSQGTWNLEVATQYLTISKVRPWGKQIWACLVEDYYYLRGTVRGWTYWSAASVEAQWQARRLNVDPDEAGIAPWFDPAKTETEEQAK
jgi:hypothetical protein